MIDHVISVVGWGKILTATSSIGSSAILGESTGEKWGMSELRLVPSQSRTSAHGQCQVRSHLLKLITSSIATREVITARQMQKRRSLSESGYSPVVVCFSTCMLSLADAFIDRFVPI